VKNLQYFFWGFSGNLHWKKKKYTYSVYCILLIKFCWKCMWPIIFKS
jgi:hypothetical protein